MIQNMFNHILGQSQIDHNNLLRLYLFLKGRLLISPPKPNLYLQIHTVFKLQCLFSILRKLNTCLHTKSKLQTYIHIMIGYVGLWLETDTTLNKTETIRNKKPEPTRNLFQNPTRKPLEKAVRDPQTYKSMNPKRRFL